MQRDARVEDSVAGWWPEAQPGGCLLQLEGLIMERLVEGERVRERHPRAVTPGAGGRAAYGGGGYLACYDSTYTAVFLTLQEPV